MTIDADELTRLRQAFATPLAGDLPREDCPTAERIWDGARGELSPSKVHETLQHVAGCSVCTELWLMAQRLEESAEGAAEEGSEVPFGQGAAARRSAAPGVGWQRLGGIAAALVLAIGIGTQVADRSESDPVTRTISESDGIRLLTRECTPQADCVLEWQGPAGTKTYTLRISLVTDPLKWLVKESTLEETRFVIPQEDLEELPPNTRLQVYLEPHHPLDGELVGLTSQVSIQ